jgi:hypothetical protein
MISTPKIGDTVLTPDNVLAEVKSVDGKMAKVAWPHPGLPYQWVKIEGTFRIRDLRKVHAQAKS